MFWLRAISQEHRPGLRAQHQDVSRAIIFLVAPRAFVFANDVAVVFIDRATGNDANLLVIAHDQAVEIEARLRFPVPADIPSSAFRNS